MPRPRIPDDYVDVAERIRGFKQQYPEGSLQSHREPKFQVLTEKREDGSEISRVYVMYCAAAYRTPDDPRPGIGWAWEPVPGPTPFTRDSELMNAETSAWGRAIVALGFETKRIASADEVRNRSGEGLPDTATRRDGQHQEPSPERSEDGREAESTPSSDYSKPTEAQIQRRDELLEELKKSDSSVKWGEVFKTYVQAKLNKQSSDLLDATEYEALLAHMEYKLHESQRIVEGVPFE